MDSVFLSRLCARLGIGTPAEEARPLSGGYLHKMYKVTTDQGWYAVKLLNPAIMRRQDAAANFARAEALETLLEERFLPILPSKVFYGQKMQRLDGRFFYVFDFYDGCAICPDAVPPKRARQIGKTLASIHQVKKATFGFEPDEMKIDWLSYLSPLEKADANTAEMLFQALSLLKNGETRRNAAILRIPPSLAVCHGDLDTKNVLWRGDDFRVIDLECLNMASPQLELMETALCWSGLDGNRIDCEVLSAFVSAYASAGGEIPRDWAAVFDANWNRPYWLKYNVERILGIGSAPDEKALGIREAQKTLKQLYQIEEERARILLALESA